MNNKTQNSPAPKGEQCQCAACGLTFVGERAFDRHRTGDYGLSKGHPNERRCRNVPEMRSAGMQVTAAGLWRITRGAANPASQLRTEGIQTHAGVTSSDATTTPPRTRLTPSVRSNTEARA